METCAGGRASGGGSSAAPGRSNDGKWRGGAWERRSPPLHGRRPALPRTSAAARPTRPETNSQHTGSTLVRKPQTVRYPAVEWVAAYRAGLAFGPPTVGAEALMAPRRRSACLEAADRPSSMPFATFDEALTI